MIDNLEYIKIRKILAKIYLFIAHEKDLVLIGEIKNDIFTTYWFWVDFGIIKIRFQVKIDIYQPEEVIIASLLNQIDQFLNKVKRYE